MRKTTTLIPIILTGLAACGGGGSSGGDTTSPATGGLVIYEAADGSGAGTATEITRIDGDTLSITGLPFDGDGTYTWTTIMVDGAREYRSPATATDPVTSEIIDQDAYIALYRASASGDTGVAIVRSASDESFGPGGYVLFREGDVVLPTSDQASYSGDYAGIRVYDGLADLSLTVGEVAASIDFAAFDGDGGVRLVISAREVFDLSYSNITADKLLDGSSALPDLTLVLAPGTLGSGGTLSGEMVSYAETGTGALVPYETGALTGLLSGDNAEEMVGVIVVEGLDPEFAPVDETWEESPVTYQETGGFIATR